MHSLLVFHICFSYCAIVLSMLHKKKEKYTFKTLRARKKQRYITVSIPTSEQMCLKGWKKSKVPRCKSLLILKRQLFGPRSNTHSSITIKLFVRIQVRLRRCEPVGSSRSPWASTGSSSLWVSWLSVVSEFISTSPRGVEGRGHDCLGSGPRRGWEAKLIRVFQVKVGHQLRVINGAGWDLLPCFWTVSLPSPPDTGYHFGGGNGPGGVQKQQDHNQPCGAEGVEEHEAPGGFLQQAWSWRRGTWDEWQ